MTAIGKQSRENLRNHRKFIHMALQEYITLISHLLRVEPGKVRILDSIKSTRIVVPKDVLPSEFIDDTLNGNETKKYHFEFKQDHPNQIQIILHGKPLVTEGQGILFFFFQALVKHLEDKFGIRKKQKTKR